MPSLPSSSPPSLVPLLLHLSPLLLPFFLPSSVPPLTQHSLTPPKKHSLAASPACVGVHVEMVQRLSDKANELMAEKVGREGGREGGGGRERKRIHSHAPSLFYYIKTGATCRPTQGPGGSDCRALGSPQGTLALPPSLPPFHPPFCLIYTVGGVRVTTHHTSLPPSLPPSLPRSPRWNERRFPPA